jgi:enterochelin esterase-like enzyme
LKQLIILVCLLCAATSAIAQESLESFTIGEKFALHSKILNEDRTYWVQLPDSYAAGAAAGRSYPVLYLLDGRAYFYVLTGVLHHLSSPRAGVERGGSAS